MPDRTRRVRKRGKFTEGRPQGETSSLVHFGWRFDCRAADAVQAVAFDAQWLREKCEQDHELGYQLLKHLVTVMASRMTATWQQLLQLSK